MNDQPGGRFRFEVALSLAGDDKRDKVRAVAEILRKELGARRVFFDEWFEAEIAGHDAHVVLQNIYGKESRLVVTCVCQGYADKSWPQEEWRAIQAFERGLRDAGAGNQRRMRFLPLRFGDGNVDGLFETAVVPDVRDREPRGIADLILERRRLSGGEAPLREELDGSSSLTDRRLAARGNGLHRRCITWGRSRTSPVDVRRVAGIRAGSRSGCRTRHAMVILSTTRTTGFFAKRSPAPSLDSVKFDTAGYEYRGEPQAGRQRVWFTAEGDGVGLYLFTLPPDLPRVDSVDDLRSIYGTGVVEISVRRVSGVPAVQLLSKHPQEPSGMTYVGALTIPFEEFSFALKVQCEERGTTGIREAVLLDRRLAAGERPVIEDGQMQVSGWNPDAAEHDAMFPSHPISRARRVLEHLRRTLVVDPSIAVLPGFPLPPASE